jgi:serine/threonine-protein kinase HipA
MRKAKICVHDQPAGILEELEPGSAYRLTYFPEYQGAPVSLTMPVAQHIHSFQAFPPFFEGLLPEGIMLEGMLRRLKIDRRDYFAQLVATGQDLVGAVTCEALPDE